ncbi:MAG: autotransporter-associated beta strand repeat-containing protein [Kiritimatiellia bacterium]
MNRKITSTCGLTVCACVFFSTLCAAGTTNTWDADTGTAGAQDGSGFWSTGTDNTNWLDNSGVNISWDNSNYPDTTIIGAGSGTAGTITLEEDITVGDLRFNAPGSGSYLLEGNGNSLNFGIDKPLLWVSTDVTVTNKTSSDNNTVDLDITGGGTIVFEGSNTFHSIDVMDANTAWYGIEGGVAGSTINIPAGASLETTGHPPIYQYKTFGFRLRDDVTLNIDGKLTVNYTIGGHAVEDLFEININPGAQLKSTSDIQLGWNARGTMNINGGYVEVINVTHTDSSTGYLNLNGGTLATHRIMSSTGQGAFEIAYNGGLLKARNNDLLKETSLKNEVATYLVKDGGAHIDSNEKDIETIVPFKRSGSGGLTKQGAGSMTFSGGSYTGATTITEGTLNLDFNRRASLVAGNTICNFYVRTSRLILNGGHFSVTGRAPAPTVTRNFVLKGASSATRACPRSGDTSGLVAGMPVIGTHIPADSFISYITTDEAFILNQYSEATSDITVPLTFSGVTNTSWQTIDTIELQQDATVNVDASGGPGTVLSAGAITGPGGLTKTGSGTLALTGTNTYSGNTSIQQGMLKLVAPIVVTNHSFEVHDPLDDNGTYGYFDYSVTSATWTFSSGTGIAEHESTWVSSDALIDGTDAAFIPAKNDERYISTTIVLPDDGLYAISFLAGARPVSGGAADMSIEIDGTERFSFDRTVFDTTGDMYSGAVELSAGSHTLTFKSIENDDVDRCTWVDLVTVASLADGGTLTGTLPATTEVTTAAGAILDLGGSTQSISGLSGNGTVTNGTLTVSGTVSPGGDATIGTLTLATAATLNDILLADVSSDGTCDLLNVDGALDITGSTLQIQASGPLDAETDYVIARFTPGELTGEFDSISFSEDMPWYIVYDNTAGEIRLQKSLGTMIMVL